MDTILIAVLERHLRKAECCGNCASRIEYSMGGYKMVCQLSHSGYPETSPTLVCDKFVLRG